MQKNLVQKEILLILVCGLINNICCIGQSLSSEKSQYLFIENKGQVADMEGNNRPDVLFTAENSGSNIYLRSTGLSYVTTKVEGLVENEEEQASSTLNNAAYLIGQRIDIDFVNANSSIEVYKENASPFQYNFYYEHCSDGVTNVGAYNKVRYQNIYNGIDGIFYSRDGSTGLTTGNGFKYDLIVQPGADPSSIKLAYTGCDKVTMENGRIIIATQVGTISEWMPRVYQVINGKVNDVEASYILNENNVLSFSIGTYNKNASLVIDPWVTFIGGNGNEHGLGIDANSNGEVVATGYTASSPLPASAGAFQMAYGGTCDAYIAKFNANGGLIFCTYYGRNAAERGTGVVFDAAGDIYFCGATRSTLMSTAGAFQTTLGGQSDMLIAKFNGAGILMWAGYYGGTAADEATGIELDGSGNLFVTGFSNGGFPTTAGCFQPSSGGGQDVVIAKINVSNPNPSIVWSTYLGGSLEEKSADIDIDVSGNVLVVGQTLSPNFPVTPGAAQGTIASTATDAFVAKFTNGGARIWITYYGGTRGEDGMGISSDAAGNIIFVGKTTSLDFPVSAGAFASTKGLVLYAGFITKLNSSGVMQWSTYYGNIGISGTEIYGVVIDKTKDLVYITGGAYQNALPFWSCAHQPNNAGGGLGGEDHFIAKINTANGYPLCNTYIGGVGHDDGSLTSPGLYGSNVGFIGGNIAFNNYDVFITAYGISTYPTTAGAYQQSFGGGAEDAIVAKICGFSCGDNNMTISFTANETTPCKGEAINFLDQSTLCDTLEAQWQWSFPGANITSSTLQHPTGISYNTPGSYDVKLVVVTPCGKDSLLLSAYINIANVIPTISGINSIPCYGQSTGGATAGMINGSAPFTYIWNTSATASSINSVPAGIYSVTITDNLGCTVTTTVSITQAPLLISNAIVSSSISCWGGNNGSLNSFVSGGTAPYLYSWSNASTATTIGSLPVGIYTLTVTDNFGCTAVSNPVSVTEPSPVSCHISSTDVLCNGGSTGAATVTASGGVGGYSYVWSNLSSGNTTNFLAAGTYSVTVTDVNGCVGTGTVMVNEPTAISVSASSTNAHCNQHDGSATATAIGGAGGYTYKWSNAVTNAINSNISAGIYSLTVTDVNGCNNISSVSISNLNGVVANIANSSDALCFNSCDGTATVSGAGGSGPYTYNWSNGSTDITTSGLCVGSFSVTITDANGCIDMAVATISQPAQMNSTLVSSPARCFSESNGSITISSTSGGTAPFNYHWQNGSVISAATGLQAGVYSVTITDANNCTAIFSSTVTEPTQLMVSSNNAVVCAGTPASLTTTAVGSVPGYNYNWSSGQVGQNINVSPTLSTLYTVTVTDANGCSATSTTSVVVNELPFVDFTTDLVNGCGPLCVTFTNITPNTSGLHWNFGDSTSGTSLIPTSHCYNIAGSYNVSLIITDNNGCVNSLTRNNYITVHPDPVAGFASNPNPVSILEPLVHFSDQSIGAATWQWSFGDVTSPSSTLQHPSYSYADTGTFEVTLIVTNEFGCRATATDYVVVQPDFSFFVPNTFTPNQDGRNDFFIPIGFGWQSEETEWYIFNRWGEIIFSADDLTNGWDGTKAGSNEKVQEGVYVWKVRLKDVNGKLHSYQGHVTVLR